MTCRTLSSLCHYVAALTIALNYAQILNRRNICKKMPLNTVPCVFPITRTCPSAKTAAAQFNSDKLTYFLYCTQPYCKTKGALHGHYIICYSVFRSLFGHYYVLLLCATCWHINVSASCICWHINDSKVSAEIKPGLLAFLLMRLHCFTVIF